MHFKFFLIVLSLIAVSVQVNAEAVTAPTTISVASVSENNVTSTVAISVVKDAQALNEAKSTLVHEHNEKLITPTSLYVEKEKPDPFVLILDDEPLPEVISGGTALYVEPENDVVVPGAKAFLCSDHEVKVSKVTLCADGEGIMPEENPQDDKKDDKKDDKSDKDDVADKDDKKDDKSDKDDVADKDDMKDDKSDKDDAADAKKAEEDKKAADAKKGKKGKGKKGKKGKGKKGKGKKGKAEAEPKEEKGDDEKEE